MPKSPTPEEALNREWLLIQNNRYDLSEQQLREYLREHPDEACAHTMLARCLFDLSRHSEAIESAKHAIFLEPDNHHPYWNLGRFYMHLQQFDNAKEYLLEAIALDSEEPYYYALLSKLYVQKGYLIYIQSKKISTEIYQQGIESARKGLDIDPEHVDSLMYLIVNLVTIGEDRYIPQAVELSEKLISLSPDNAIAHEFYARALNRQIGRVKNKQDLNRVIKILDESLRLNPRQLSAKDFGSYLLFNFFAMIPRDKPWKYDLINTSILAAIPLLIFTFYCYNILGLQFLTIFSAIATSVSLLSFADINQICIRNLAEPNYRKFILDSFTIIALLWIIFVTITIIGISWQYLPKHISGALNLLLWVCLPFVPRVVFILMRQQHWANKITLLLEIILLIKFPLSILIYGVIWLYQIECWRGKTIEI